MEALKSKLQSDPNSSGSEFPTDYPKLNHGFVFYHTLNDKIYAIVQPVDNEGNVIDKLIKLRQGDFKWVELLYDEEKKGMVYGTVVATPNELVTYPTNDLADLMDIISNIYIRFDYTNPTSQQLLKDLKNPENITKAIEDYLGLVIDIKLTELLTSDPDVIGKLYTSLAMILYGNYTR